MFTFNHYNYNVLDLEKSMAFYKSELNIFKINMFSKIQPVLK